LSGKRTGPQEEKQKVPSYIVTFSDMVTLLLTFFVLLLTLAEVQDPELFNMGRDSFWESIRHCGLGALLGNEVSVDLGADSELHPTSEPTSSGDRTIDEYRQKLRRIFERINESTTTLPSQLVGQHLEFSITNVRFASGVADLSAEAKQSLSRYSLDLLQNLDSENDTLYVLGLAGDEASETQQWILSARRAQAVAHFLQEQLATSPIARPGGMAREEPPPWRVLWWGAGPGGNWAGQDRPDPGQSQILIAVLRSDV
jgi:chemotaxis protein MotB